MKGLEGTFPPPDRHTPVKTLPPMSAGGKNDASQFYSGSSTGPLQAVGE